MRPKPYRNKRIYGSIPHLKGSRNDQSDKIITEGQERILTQKKRDKLDLIIVTEKLDGSCVGLYKKNGVIIPLTRDGYDVKDSFYKQHHYFGYWVDKNKSMLSSLLNDEELLVGEWLCMAHGIKYELKHEPFVPFDLFRENKRVLYEEFKYKIANKLTMPYEINNGDSFAKESVDLNKSHHGGEYMEGFVYRVERKGAVDFLAKYVNPIHKCGSYFNEDESKLIYNWRHDVLPS